MSEELKECPFCGGKAIVFMDAKTKWCIMCKECPATLGYHSQDNLSGTEAIKAWNTRHNELVALDEDKVTMTLGKVKHYKDDCTIGDYSDAICSTFGTKPTITRERLVEIMKNEITIDSNGGGEGCWCDVDVDSINDAADAILKELSK